MKPIPDFPGYFADKFGNIYSTKRIGIPRILKPNSWYLRNNKRTFYSLRTGQGKKYQRGAVLILSTFISSRPKGMFACHGILGSGNDSLENVYWATPRQNNLDQKRDGTQPHRNGEKCPTHKLNNLQVRIIKRFCETRKNRDMSCTYLASIFSCSISNISYIYRGKTWKYIQS